MGSPKVEPRDMTKEMYSLESLTSRVHTSFCCQREVNISEVGLGLKSLRVQNKKQGWKRTFGEGWAGHFTGLQGKEISWMVYGKGTKSPLMEGMGFLQPRVHGHGKLVSGGRERDLTLGEAFNAEPL